MAEAHAQLDLALSHGINFIDTAEMYPSPPDVPGAVPGITETIIGTYFQRHPHLRSQIILASKVIGYESSSRIAAYRTSPPQTPPYPSARLDANSVKTACEASLQRLQTDYIDLYQLHWPDRWAAAPDGRAYLIEHERDSVPIEETLSALHDLLKEGKIRAYGLSNDTTFGLCEATRVADRLGMPRPASIQNSFCLLNRAAEYELAEAMSARNLNVGFLPYSALAGGMLTGKYEGKVNEHGQVMKDVQIQNSRFVQLPTFQKRYHNKCGL